MLKNMANKLKIMQVVCKLPTKITAISLMMMIFAMVITGCAGQISDDCTGDWSYNKLPSNYEIWKVDDSYNALVRVDMDNPNEAKEVVTDTVKEFVLVDETIFLKAGSAASGPQPGLHSGGLPENGRRQPGVL